MTGGRWAWIRTASASRAGVRQVPFGRPTGPDVLAAVVLPGWEAVPMRQPEFGS
ncbi:hypothetical protein [Amycolatopsis circi]|uniref:hypothetical protein n=1 Tax=Amycolatopsis circi TaxID=871959 RepID=UPI0013BE9C59|nr:hypothetical protein [Amycolatopsis circi]